MALAGPGRVVCPAPPSALPSSLHSVLMQLGGSPFWCRPPTLRLLWSSAISLAALRCPGLTAEGGAPGPSRCLLCAAVVSFSILPAFGPRERRRRPALTQPSDGAHGFHPLHGELPLCARAPLLGGPCDITAETEASPLVLSAALGRSGLLPGPPASQQRRQRARRPGVFMRLCRRFWCWVC